MQLRIGPGGKEGHAWRQRLACERGIALPTAVMLLMAVMLLASAAGIAAISAMGQSTHDRGTKRAVAAADAGLDTAIYRLNKLKPGALLCVVAGVPELVLQPITSGGWCPEQTENLGDGASFSYRMSAGLNLDISGQGLVMQRKIVATGTANGVSRRAMATVNSLTGVSVFGGNAVTSLTGLTLPDNTRIIGDAATNGAMSLTGTSQLCGTPLFGTSFSGSSHVCPGFTPNQTSQQLILNPVNPPGGPYDHTRFGSSDPFVLQFLSSWNSTSRVLKLRAGSTLTLTGNTYSFCYLEIKDLAQLIISPRLPTQTPVKIYIEAPDSPTCLNHPVAAERGKVLVKDQGAITNLNATSNTLQISAVGHATTPTDIRFESLVSNLIGVVYAPNSTVALDRANAILGSVAAKTVELEDSARIQWHPSADITLDDLLPLFKRTSWVECKSTATGAAPDAGC